MLCIHQVIVFILTSLYIDQHNTFSKDPTTIEFSIKYHLFAAHQSMQMSSMQFWKHVLCACWKDTHSNEYYYSSKRHRVWLLEYTLVKHVIDGRLRCRSDTYGEFIWSLFPVTQWLHKKRCHIKGPPATVPLFSGDPAHYKTARCPDVGFTSGRRRRRRPGVGATADHPTERGNLRWTPVTEFQMQSGWESSKIIRSRILKFMPTVYSGAQIPSQTGR